MPTDSITLFECFRSPMTRMRYKNLMTAFLLAFGALWQAASHGAEFEVREAGVTFQLPAAWQANASATKIPTGQLMQRWVRDPVRANGRMAAPGMLALATPIPRDANLALVTQQVLAREPYRKKLAAETDCIKCMIYKLRTPHGTVMAFAPDSSSACDSIQKSGDVAECSAEPVNHVGLKIEPSWAHRFDSATPAGPMKVVLIHAITGGKLVEISFWYPPEAAGQIEEEIADIVSTMRIR